MTIQKIVKTEPQINQVQPTSDKKNDKLIHITIEKTDKGTKREFLIKNYSGGWIIVFIVISLITWFAVKYADEIHSLLFMI